MELWEILWTVLPLMTVWAKLHGWFSRLWPSWIYFYLAVSQCTSSNEITVKTTSTSFVFFPHISILPCILFMLFNLSGFVFSFKVWTCILSNVRGLSILPEQLRETFSLTKYLVTVLDKTPVKRTKRFSFTIIELKVNCEYHMHFKIAMCGQ